MSPPVKHWKTTWRKSGRGKTARLLCTHGEYVLYVIVNYNTVFQVSVFTRVGKSKFPVSLWHRVNKTTVIIITCMSFSTQTTAAHFCPPLQSSAWHVALTAVWWWGQGRWGGRALLAHVSDPEWVPFTEETVCYRTEIWSYISHGSPPAHNKEWMDCALLKSFCFWNVVGYSISLWLCPFLTSRFVFLWHQDSTFVGSLLGRL